jgi:NlpE C-terminal OB domain
MGAAAFGLALVPVALATTIVVKGELSFDKAGVGKIAECDSGREFTLGLMASTPYFQLVQKYWEMSNRGKSPVLIEVRGDVAKTSDPKTESTLQSPSVVTLVAGGCAK